MTDKQQIQEEDIRFLYTALINQLDRTGTQYLKSLRIADEMAKDIFRGLRAIDVLERISIYVRILQDGDPENENPQKILDYIDNEISLLDNSQEKEKWMTFQKPI